MSENELRAIFIGVKDRKNTTRDEILNDNKCIYQFQIGGKLREFYIDSTDNYDIQNRLMPSYEYLIKTRGNVITSVRIADIVNTHGIVKNFKPGEKTIKNFLLTAIAPLGKTLYVYGGGWNFQDDNSSYITRTIGVSPTWEKFYNTTDANYEYEGETFPNNGWNAYYYAGLDCSGYVGWDIYNTMNTESEVGNGYVCSSTRMAKELSDKYKYGKWVKPNTEDYREISKKLHPGDIVSIAGHVYIVLGTCSDGSAVIIHSTVTKSSTGYEGGGVQLSAISINGDNDTECEAYKLAKKYTDEYYKDWAEKYPVVVKPVSMYFSFPKEQESTGIFTWESLDDPDGIREMSADKVLSKIFNK